MQYNMGVCTVPCWERARARVRGAGTRARPLPLAPRRAARSAVMQALQELGPAVEAHLQKPTDDTAARLGQSVGGRRRCTCGARGFH